ncbi:replication-relaxation family protein [Streptomyces sp. NRRL S-87]|uniref:replication-relaxation family protein n=1 Tax=Streptomyces sp. NRRL S-87 TaxID=1463920 RepID=UPI00099DA849|nr:replication-relaxation family protein [Streptomyces sp. NRRL S-87]
MGQYDTNGETSYREVTVFSFFEHDRGQRHLATRSVVAQGQYLTDWQGRSTAPSRRPSFHTDAVLAVPTKTSEVRFFELDNGTMSQARLAKEVWDYERYAGHRVWEGVRGTIGGTYPFWQRHRYTRSETFPRLHVVLAGKAEHLLDNRLQALSAAVQGITIAVWANTLPNTGAAPATPKSARYSRPPCGGRTAATCG